MIQHRIAFDGLARQRGGARRRFPIGPIEAHIIERGDGDADGGRERGLGFDRARRGIRHGGVRSRELDLGRGDVLARDLARRRRRLEQPHLFGAQSGLRSQMLQRGRGLQVVDQRGSHGASHRPGGLRQIEPRGQIQASRGLHPIAALARGLERERQVEGQQIRTGNSRRELEAGVRARTGGEQVCLRFGDSRSRRIKAWIEIEGGERQGPIVPGGRRPRLTEGVLRESTQPRIGQPACLERRGRAIGGDRRRVIVPGRTPREHSPEQQRESGPRRARHDLSPHLRLPAGAAPAPNAPPWYTRCALQ